MAEIYRPVTFPACWALTAGAAASPRPASPRPGGVGPMARAMLLANVVEAAEG